MLVGYDWHGGYGHPDHVKVHPVVHRAAELAARRPRLLESTMNRDLVRGFFEAAVAAGAAGPGLRPGQPDGRRQPARHARGRDHVAGRRPRLPGAAPGLARGAPQPGHRHRGDAVDAGRGVRRRSSAATTTSSPASTATATRRCGWVGRSVTDAAAATTPAALLRTPQVVPPAVRRAAGAAAERHGAARAGAVRPRDRQRLRPGRPAHGGVLPRLLPGRPGAVARHGPARPALRAGARRRAVVAGPGGAAAGRPAAPTWPSPCVAGVATPPLEPALRTLWPSVLSPRQVPSAFALDAAAQELIFVLGPLVVLVAQLAGVGGGLVAAGVLGSGRHRLVRDVAGLDAVATTGARGPALARAAALAPAVRPLRRRSCWWASRSACPRWRWSHTPSRSVTADWRPGWWRPTPWVPSSAASPTARAHRTVTHGATCSAGSVVLVVTYAALALVPAAAVGHGRCSPWPVVWGCRRCSPASSSSSTGWPRRAPRPRRSRG